MLIILTNIKSIEPKASITLGKENLIDKKIKKKIKPKRKLKKKKKNIKNRISPNINNNNNNTKKNKDKEIKSKNDIIQTTQNEKGKSFSNTSMLKILKLKSYDISIKYANELLKIKDFEMNLLEYEEALKIDKRNYFQYYLSLLKYNHPIMFSIGAYNDYNLRIIKIFLFFFSFSSDFTINALFFNDDTMHKIYQDKGEYNFFYQITQILYSSLISRFIDTLIKNFALLQDNIIELKQEKRKTKLEKIYNIILNIIKIKMILFFVCAFVILSFCWYYITCFCCIYANTQIHLIKDSVISFITSLIIPFGLYLIPGIFRIISLRMNKSSGRLLYKFSAFLENYLV